MRKITGTKTEKVLREHRFKRRWIGMVTALSLVVALGMSYALILPAITMEGKLYGEDEQQIVNDESFDTTEAENPINESNTEDTLYKSVVIERTINDTAEDGASVTVKGDLPEDAEVTIEPIIMNEEQVAAYIENSRSITVQSFVVYDIAIISNGEEWQPDDSVSVIITKPDVKLGEKDKYAVTHIDDDGQAADVKTEVIEDGSIEFTVDGFSLYIIYTYTVDFHYGDLVFSIKGASSILLSEIFDVLNIDMALDEVNSVAFSDDSLIRIEKTQNTDDHQDWKLISLSPFKSEEELTVTLKDGQTITILVTDAIGDPVAPSTGMKTEYAETYDSAEQFPDNSANDWQIPNEQHQYAYMTQKGNDGMSFADRYTYSSDNAVRLQKAVIPTAIENEFQIYLNVQPRLSWEEFFKSLDNYQTHNNSSTFNPSSGVSRLLSQNEYENLSAANKRLFSPINVTYTLSGGRSYTVTRYGNFTGDGKDAIQNVPNGSYAWSAEKFNTNGLINNINWRSLLTAYQQGRPLSLTVDMRSVEQRYDFATDPVYPQTVTDPMGENIIYKGKISFDEGSVVEPEEVNENTLTWTLPHANYPEPPYFSIHTVEGYVPGTNVLGEVTVLENIEIATRNGKLTAYYTGVLEGRYAIELDVENSSAPLTNSPTNSVVPTNGRTILSYDVGHTANTTDFAVPKVRGLLYDITFKKQDQDGNPLSGAKFVLSRKVEGIEYFYTGDEENWYELASGETLKDAVQNGMVYVLESTGNIDKFASLVCGDYVLYEIEAPKGYYKASSAGWGVPLCYTTTPGLLTHVNAAPNMRYTGRDTNGEWIITNPQDPINPPELPEVPEPPIWLPDMDPYLSKQIDYLGDNEGEMDRNNPDTALDDNGVTGLDDMYRLYLNLQGDSLGLDLVLVIDASDSMFSNYIGGLRRIDVLENFLNGTNDKPGFVESFLNANNQNQLSVVSFGYTAETLLDWTQTPTEIHVPQSGWTNYTAGLYVADEQLHEPAAINSGNQKLVIFLGDGSVTAAYHDGLMHNDTDEKYICVQGINGNPGTFLYILLREIRNGTLTNQDIYRDSNSGEELYYITGLGTPPSSRAVVRLLRDLQMEIPGFTNGVGITDSAAFEEFYATFNSGGPSHWAEVVSSISNAPLPTRTVDLYKLTDHAFLQFKELNPDVVVHSIGFSTEIEKEEVDLLGIHRNQSEVLRFMAKYGQGQYHYCDDAQSLEDAIYSICFMVNAEVTDSLSVYVQAAADPELKVVQKDLEGENEVVLYENDALTTEGERILEGVTLSPDGKITVTFKPEYIVSSSQIYTASFNVQLTPEAYTQFVANGGKYPDVGDIDTDFGLNDTSSEREGFFSNTEGKVTWTVAGSQDEKDFPHPVVQIPESRLYELPHTGGRGILLYTIGGIALMCTALMIYSFSSRRKRERRSKC